MDDIWNWVHDLTSKLYENDQGALADKIDNFSTLASNKDAEAVEALFPELLAYARSTENAWLEVFLRHWRLQAYVNSAADPRPLVPDALDLLAFTHSEEAANCPQNTCVVDDISDIYSAIDAKGFAPISIEMIDEAMDGLSTNVGCYVCMSFSKFGALMDLNEPEKAIAYMEEAKSKSSFLQSIVNANGFYGSYFYEHLAPIFVRAHIMNNEPELALELAEKCAPKAEYNKSELDFLIAQAYAMGSNFEAAKEYLDKGLSYETSDIHVQRLVEVLPSFTAQGLVDGDLGPRLIEIAENAHSRGRAAEAFNCAGFVFDLGAKEAPEISKGDIAASALNIMRAVKDNLADPQEAKAEIESLVKATKL